MIYLLIAAGFFGYYLGMISGISLVYYLIKRKEENKINYPYIDDEIRDI